MRPSMGTWLRARSSGLPSASSGPCSCSGRSAATPLAPSLLQSRPRATHAAAIQTLKLTSSGRGASLPRASSGIELGWEGWDGLDEPDDERTSWRPQEPTRTRSRTSTRPVQTRPAEAQPQQPWA
eukprot:scaffold170558_cov18-Prasinocladus_malaysianus.AAC.1